MTPVPNYLMLIILFVAKWTRDFSRLFLRVKEAEAHIMDHASWKAWRPPLESYQDAPHWGALDPFILIKRQPQMTATRHHLQGREKMDETSVQVENWILHLLILFSTFWEQSNNKWLQNSSMGSSLFWSVSASIWHFFRRLFQPVAWWYLQIQFSA